MELNGRPHSPAVFPWEGTLVPIMYGVDGGQGRSGRCGEQKNHNILRWPE